MLKQQNEQDVIYDKVKAFSKSKKMTFYVEISKKWLVWNRNKHKSQIRLFSLMILLNLFLIYQIQVVSLFHFYLENYRIKYVTSHHKCSKLII